MMEERYGRAGEIANHILLWSVVGGLSALGLGAVWFAVTKVIETVASPLSEDTSLFLALTLWAVLYLVLQSIIAYLWILKRNRIIKMGEELVLS